MEKPAYDATFLANFGMGIFGYIVHCSSSIVIAPLIQTPPDAHAVIGRNKDGYTAHDAPSTRLEIARNGRTDGRTDGHTLL